MNEKKICACVGARTRDTQKSKEHYEENFIPAGWNLEYTCLDQPEAARALYLTGVCLHCGGQLGKKFNIPGELTGDALLEQIYHQMESCRPFDQRFDGGAYRTSLSMRAYWYMEQDDLTLSAKNAQFLKLFHAEDQGVVEDWISRCHAEEPYTAPRRDRKSALLYIYETESPGPDAHAEQSHFDLLDAYNELARRHRRSRFEHREDVSKVRTFSLHLEL